MPPIPAVIENTRLNAKKSKELNFPRSFLGTKSITIPCFNGLVEFINAPRQIQNGATMIKGGISAIMKNMKVAMI